MILLDTNVWLRWVRGVGSLSDEQLDALSAALAVRGGVLISPVSAWEIGLLVERKRIRLHMPVESWVRESLNASGFAMVPLTRADAVASTRLPGEFHRDPADRFLVATARRLGVPLVTVDGLIRGYPHVETI